MFCNALAGLEDDAAIEGYSEEGRELLRQALKVFDQECRERHGSYPSSSGLEHSGCAIPEAAWRLPAEADDRCSDRERLGLGRELPILIALGGCLRRLATRNEPINV